MDKDSIKIQYDNNYSLYERAGKNVIEALTIFLNEINIPFLGISQRVKEFDSFYEKIERKKYKDAFSENEDFCGVRVVLYYLEDIMKLKELISKEFDVQNNENKSENLDVNEFGYRSFHFIIKFNKNWLSTPNYRGLENVKVEIQVRTILMHAWAEIEHKLGYKNKEQVPKELMRKLFIISAKLEEADSQFQDLKNNIENYKSEIIEESHKKGHFTSKEFNLNTFQALLNFYFSDLEENAFMASELFQKIQNKGLTIEKLIEYAEKVKPLISSIIKLINGDKSYKTNTTQANMMIYAIEAYFDENFLENASNERKKIIKQIIELKQ